MNLILITSVLLWAGTIIVSGTANGKLNEQVAIEGSSYKMKCIDLTSKLSPYIFWAVNGQPPKEPKYRILNDGLVIRNVSGDDTLPNYTCTVLDRYSYIPVQVETIRLKVKQRTGRLIESRKPLDPMPVAKVKIWGVVNQSKILPCSVFSRPRPIFQWKNYQTGKDIKNTTDLFQIFENDETSNLTIHIHNETLYGDYICEASNILGKSSQHFVLSEGYKPQAPFMYPILITTNKITLQIESLQTVPIDRNTGHLMEVLPITKHILQVRIETKSEQESDEWFTPLISNEPNGNIPYASKFDEGIFELKNLNSSTTYLVRSAVSNDACMSDFSASIKITTDENEMPLKSGASNDQLTTTMQPHHNAENGRREHGRSFEKEIEINSNVANVDTTYDMAICKHPKFKKTVIRTVVSTTFFENIEENETNQGNSSLIKRHIEEDTTIQKTNVCSLE